MLPVDSVVPEVGLNGAPGVFVVDMGGQRLFEPQARSVGQQPPPKDAGHDLKPVEQTVAVVTDVPIDVEEGGTGEEEGRVDEEELLVVEEERDGGGVGEEGGDGLPGITTVVVDVLITGGTLELVVVEGGREDTVGCTVTVAVDAKMPKALFQ